jgi:hypothetical protein
VYSFASVLSQVEVSVIFPGYLLYLALSIAKASI